MIILKECLNQMHLFQFRGENSKNRCQFRGENSVNNKLDEYELAIQYSYIEREVLD